MRYLGSCHLVGLGWEVLIDLEGNRKEGVSMERVNLRVGWLLTNVINSWRFGTLPLMAILWVWKIFVKSYKEEEIDLSWGWR
jgi:hypothetical protein